jgi:NAD(P)H dehydrogenase (quinone)
MSIVITGATGQLGRLVVEQPMAAGTPPDTIIATGRDTDELTALARDGVTVRRADFADPRTLTDAFASAETLLLISTATVGERFDNHRNAIDAARRRGVADRLHQHRQCVDGADAAGRRPPAHRGVPVR